MAEVAVDHQHELRIGVTQQIRELARLRVRVEQRDHTTDPRRRANR